jgi:hypothetical protein
MLGRIYYVCSSALASLASVALLVALLTWGGAAAADEPIEPECTCDFQVDCPTLEYGCDGTAWCDTCTCVDLWLGDWACVYIQHQPPSGQ